LELIPIGFISNKKYWKKTPIGIMSRWGLFKSDFFPVKFNGKKSDWIFRKMLK
jgi:hypothetical protein